MKGFVYKWVNNLNGKWYIGSHKGSVDDGYTASGNAINSAFDKYGIENFTRYIIYEGDDYRLVEELSLESHDAANDPMSYNLKNKAIGGFDHINNSGKNRHFGNKFGVLTDEARAKGRVKAAEARTGASHTEEARRKISEARKGKKHSEETRKLISQKVKAALARKKLNNDGR